MSLTPEAMHVIRMIILAGMLGGFVVAVIATGRAMYNHEKQKKNRGENL